MISKNIDKVLLIMLCLFLLIGWFYWFQYRPSKIIIYCNWRAGNKVGWRINSSISKEHYENEYKFCLREKGLK